MEKIKAAWAVVKKWWKVYIEFTFWKIVFWWKKKSGFIDLHQEVTVIGEVVWSDFGKNPDGDYTMHVKPDYEYQWLITMGNRKTSADSDYPETLHCEVVPWMRDQFKESLDKLKIGSRVKITGSWGFDGVHIGKNEFIEVLAALWRHQPNVKDGWFEIHPVKNIEVW